MITGIFKTVSSAKLHTISPEIVPTSPLPSDIKAAAGVVYEPFLRIGQSAEGARRLRGYRRSAVSRDFYQRNLQEILIPSQIAGYLLVFRYRLGAVGAVVMIQKDKPVALAQLLADIDML
jgi:hypothetical protein